MLSIKEIKAVFDGYNGMIRTHQLHEARIYHNDIQSFIKQGIIETHYGYYQLIGSENLSEAATVTRLSPDAVMCMDTHSNGLAFGCQQGQRKKPL